jgi:hypothetical protein
MVRFARLLLTPLLLVLIASVCSIPATAQDVPQRLYMPVVFTSDPPSMFAVETSFSGMIDDRVANQARTLGASWLRLNGVQWSAVEPVRGAPYNWTALVEFDQALDRAKEAGLIPVVIIRGTPLWAAVANSGCAAVSDTYLPDYTRFLAALVQRYQGQVSYWELGNEPDVDYSLVASDSVFGCWGDIHDPYYGGQRYGRMLRAVVPAMRAANPNTVIVAGGLLLDRPQTTDPNYGRPELFLEGVLMDGAADSFDIVAYHSYPSYRLQNVDYDQYPGDVWTSLGGRTTGKARYLRELMARYGVSKPLWLNETGLLCTPSAAACDPPSASFFEAQADMMVRIMSRAAADGIQQVSWYTLDGPGWRSSGLLDENQNPRPAFDAYQRLIATVGRYSRVSQVNDYGAEVEAYRFVKSDSVIDVVWSRSGGATTISVPAESYRSAMTRSGAPPSLSQDSAQVLVSVGFSAVFIERTP